MSEISNQAAIDAVGAIAGTIAALSVSLATASGVSVSSTRHSHSGNRSIPMTFSPCTPETAKKAAELRWRQRQAADAALRYGDPFWDAPRTPPSVNQDTAEDKQLRMDFGEGQFEKDYVMLKTNPMAAMIYAFRTTVYGESHRTAILRARRGGVGWGLIKVMTKGGDRETNKQRSANDVHRHQLDGRPNIH